MNNLKIGTKLFLSFGIVILLLIGLAGVMLYSFTSVNSSTGQILALLEASTRAGGSVNSANEARRSFFRYLLWPTDDINKEFDDVLKETTDSVQDIVDNSSIAENVADATNILETLSKVKTAKEDYLKAGRKVDSILEDCTRVSDKVRKDLEDLGEAITAEIERNSNIDASKMLKLEIATYNAQGYVYLVLRCRDNYIRASDEKVQNQYLELLPVRMGELKAEIEKIQNDPGLAELGDVFVRRVEEIIQGRNNWDPIVNSLVATVKEQRAMVDPLLADIRLVMRGADGKGGVAGIQTRVDDLAHKTGTEQQTLIAFFRMLGIIIAVVAFIGSVLMGWILSTSIATGIRAAVEAMTTIADDGNVGIEVPEAFQRRGDEIGMLARAVKAILTQFQNVEHLATELADGNYDLSTKVRSDLDTMNINLNKMLEQVNQAMSEIGESVRQVATGSGEVSSASQSLSNGAQESAASLEEITASMSEISSQTKTNAESAGQARDLAQKASQAATEGQSAMQEMTTAMGRITQNSNEIQRVIKVIDDIAFQTNLLALNAAVEAARAGQHGKGFAVVAEEVRNLASRSAKAAKETSDLIAKSGQEIEKGGEVASHTASVLNTIVEQVKQTTDLVAGIAIASNEQAQGVNQVTVGLQQIDTVTQQNTAAAEESASAANEMSGMATTLQNLVAKFRLRGQTGTSRTSSTDYAPPKHTAAPPHPAAAKVAPAAVKPVAQAPVQRHEVPKSANPEAPVSDDKWGGGRADVRIDLDSKDFGKF